MAVSWKSRQIGKSDGSPNSHSWLTKADEIFGIDQLPSIFHLNAKWDSKQEVPSDSMGVSRWLILLSSFPGNQTDLRTVLSVSWNCQVQTAEERVQGGGIRGEPPSRIKTLKAQWS